MTSISRRLLALYLAALLSLALVGAHNQHRLKHQYALESRHQLLQTRLSTLRSEAAGITGTLAVRSWAQAHKMVASPEALNITEIDPGEAPRLAQALPAGKGVEVQTLWH